MFWCLQVYVASDYHPIFVYSGIRVKVKSQLEIIWV